MGRARFFSQTRGRDAGKRSTRLFRHDRMGAMAKSYRPWAPTQSFLLPPSPLEWLEEGHLAYFVLDVVTESLDLRAIERVIQAKDWRGERPYAPTMMVALLIYAYSVGVFSSRKMARATYEDVGFRVLAGGE